MPSSAISKTYLQTLEDLKSQIKTSRIKAHLAINQEMLVLYWKIGKTILARQDEEGWGTKVTRSLSEDLSRAFPEMRGLSYTNIRYMQRFAETYPDLLIYHQPGGKLSKNQKELICQQPAGKLRYRENWVINETLRSVVNIPWFHNIVLIDKVKSGEQRLWYMDKIIENGWSRNVLIHQINSDLYKRQALKEIKTHNFKLTLPNQQSDLAEQILKDEYNFEFIDPSNILKERDLEKALVDDVVKFLLELGAGFAFVGKQYHLEVANQDFYIDLLFYHLKLRSYIVIELKTGKFKPEYVGKLGFYLSCVDDYLKTDNDNSSVGIILCEDEDKEIRHRSLQCMIKPIGVSTYKIAKKNELPEELKPLELKFLKNK